MSHPLPQPAGRRWGLVSKRERWGLTWRGWVLLAAATAGLAAVAGWRIYPFLAITATVESPVVVVEAWVPPAILKDLAARYQGEDESILYCTGGPSDQAFESTRIEDTSAAAAARMLKGYGIPEHRLKVVPCWVPRRDRTYANAVAVREWFKDQQMTVTAINVVTEGPHSRRSRLMFEAAFGSEASIGVVSIPDRDYEAARWWRYSEGVKAVISEAAAYVYARLLFQPGGGAK